MSEAEEYSPEASQLDFWVGDWDVSWGEGEKGTNQVVRILGGRFSTGEEPSFSCPGVAQAPEASISPADLGTGRSEKGGVRESRGRGEEERIGA